MSLDSYINTLFMPRVVPRRRIAPILTFNEIVRENTGVLASEIGHPDFTTQREWQRGLFTFYNVSNITELSQQHFEPYGLQIGCLYEQAYSASHDDHGYRRCFSFVDMNYYVICGVRVRRRGTCEFIGDYLFDDFENVTSFAHYLYQIVNINMVRR